MVTDSWNWTSSHICLISCIQVYLLLLMALSLPLSSLSRLGWHVTSVTYVWPTCTHTCCISVIHFWDQKKNHYLYLASLVKILETRIEKIHPWGQTFTGKWTVTGKSFYNIHSPFSVFWLFLKYRDRLILYQWYSSCLNNRLFFSCGNNLLFLFASLVFVSSAKSP